MIKLQGVTRYKKRSRLTAFLFATTPVATDRPGKSHKAILRDTQVAINGPEIAVGGAPMEGD